MQTYFVVRQRDRAKVFHVAKLQDLKTKRLAMALDNAKDYLSVEDINNLITGFADDLRENRKAKRIQKLERRKRGLAGRGGVGGQRGPLSRGGAPAGSWTTRGLGVSGEGLVKRGGKGGGEEKEVKASVAEAIGAAIGGKSCAENDPDAIGIEMSQIR